MEKIKQKKSKKSIKKMTLLEISSELGTKFAKNMSARELNRRKRLLDHVIFSSLNFLDLNYEITSKLKKLAKARQKPASIMFLLIWCNEEDLMLGPKDRVFQSEDSSRESLARERLQNELTFSEPEVKKIQCALKRVKLSLEMYPEQLKKVYGTPESDWWLWYDLTMPYKNYGIPKEKPKNDKKKKAKKRSRVRKRIMQSDCPMASS